VSQPVAFSVIAALLTLGLLAVVRQSADLLGAADEPVTLPAGETADRSASRRLQTEHELHPKRAADPPPDPIDLDPARAQPPTPSAGGGAQELELTPAMVIANVAATQGLIAGIVLAAGWYFAIPADAFGVTADPLSTGLPAIGVGIGFGVLLWTGNELATTLADAVGAAYDEGVREMLAPESPGGWVLLFGGVLPTIAVAEELLFRAALIGVPAASFPVSPWLLAAASSLAFALGHGAQGRVGVVVTGLLGFALAAGYILSGSLLVVVVAHYVVNALEFFVYEYLSLEI
jgi:membrane protease YdiL (CAAX protease family)